MWYVEYRRVLVARMKTLPVPEVGEEAPEFHLPSAQGGQLRLSMRTARGPVVVVFFRGPWSEEDVAYFEALSAKEDEINHAAASVVGIGAIEPGEAREFVRASGIKSYVLYDYVRITTREWGLLQKDKEHDQYARPAVFIVDSDRMVVNAWIEELPRAEEILAKVSEVTGLPKSAEETEEKPEEAAAEGGEKPKKMSAEERERIKAERRAAREAGKSVKTGERSAGEASEEEKPKKMSAEERERIKAERRAAREAGKSGKTGRAEQSGEVPEGESRTKEQPEAEESGAPEATEEGEESGERPAEARAGSEPENSGEEE